MTHPPAEITRARQILDAVAPLPGARERIYRRIVAKSSPSRPLYVKLATAILVSCSLASAAYGLGMAMRTTASNRTTIAGESDKAPPPRTSVVRRAQGITTTMPVPTASPRIETLAPNPKVDVNAEPPLPASVTGPTGVLTTTMANSRRRSTVAAPPTVATSTVTDGVSELSLQVSEYQSAIALLNADPAGALGQLQVHRRRWPRSAIAHEVDLRIVQTLVLLHRQSEAQASAQAFLRRYPDSARADEVRRIAESIH